MISVKHPISVRGHKHAARKRRIPLRAWMRSQARCGNESAAMWCQRKGIRL